MLLRQAGKEDELAELDFERQHMEYFYTRQRRQLGLGHAIQCAEPLVGQYPFVVALGDSIIGLNAESRIVKRMVDVFESLDADVVIAMEEVTPSEVHRYGIAKPRGDAGDVFELESIVEKPDVGSAPSNLAVVGRYVFNPVIFEELRDTKPGKSGEVQLTDAIQRMLADGYKGIGVRLMSGERRYDIGNFESYFRAFTEFALADPVYGESLRKVMRSLVLPRDED
jgi:UTP--glucose-1-phosphate uridylyltransferase